MPSAQLLSTSTTGDTPVSGHLITQANGGAATTIAAGAGAGTSPGAITVTGNDTTGLISVLTGTSCTANATVATITFGAAFASAPHASIESHNVSAAALSGATQAFATGETTALFIIKSNATGLANATTYEWTYFVAQ